MSRPLPSAPPPPRGRARQRLSYCSRRVRDALLSLRDRFTAVGPVVALVAAVLGAA